MASALSVDLRERVVAAIEWSAPIEVVRSLV